VFTLDTSQRIGVRYARQDLKTCEIFRDRMRCDRHDMAGQSRNSATLLQAARQLNVLSLLPEEQFIPGCFSHDLTLGKHNATVDILMRSVIIVVQHRRGGPAPRGAKGYPVGKPFTIWQLLRTHQHVEIRAKRGYHGEKVGWQPVAVMCHDKVFEPGSLDQLIFLARDPALCLESLILLNGAQLRLPNQPGTLRRGSTYEYFVFDFVESLQRPDAGNKAIDLGVAVPIGDHAKAVAGQRRRWTARPGQAECRLGEVVGIDGFRNGLDGASRPRHELVFQRKTGQQRRLRVAQQQRTARR
jgi:hypothetical protein